MTVHSSVQTHKAPAGSNGPNADLTVCCLYGLDQITQVTFSTEKYKLHRFSCTARGFKVCMLYITEWLDKLYITSHHFCVGQTHKISKLWLSSYRMEIIKGTI